MRAESKAQREAQIEAAAYSVLDRKGFAGASMLAIAREAKASNETLYNWYGDKTGLFQALVMRNAQEIRETLERALAETADARATLARVGPQLLTLLLTPRAIALNRAAAADPSGTLGAALSTAGRGTIAPLIAQLLDLAARQSALRAVQTPEDVAARAETYLSLLIGDLQIRQVAGHQTAPTQAALNDRADRALAHLETLYPPEADQGCAGSAG